MGFHNNPIIFYDKHHQLALNSCKFRSPPPRTFFWLKKGGTKSAMTFFDSFYMKIQWGWGYLAGALPNSERVDLGGRGLSMNSR